MIVSLNVCLKKNLTVLPDGWCADAKQAGDKWLEVDLGQAGMGISGVIVAPQTSHPQNYPLEVLIQYVPRGGQSLVDFPFPQGNFVSIEFL